MKFDKIKPFIIQAMVMKLSETETLHYLNDNSFKISPAQYYRYKKRIRESRYDRLNQIGKEGFIDQHLMRLDNLELINQELWSLYRLEKNPIKKATILMDIAEIQQYISGYYDSTAYVLEHSTMNKKRKKWLLEQEQEQEHTEQIEAVA